MSYSIRIKASAAKSLRRIPSKERIGIIEVIDRLSEEPFAGGVLKGEFSGLRRLRVRQYRIVDYVSEGRLEILVIRVGHRREVYR